ncbi:Gfo/Idh/MocA family protein [Candidatus Allofournierella merdavium]|uniref:Gfo/Idh/MocA family protein n=1 Tax=Candidatus Allofournierella merdavium TaxID=2838593 RepID=UPI00374F021F
MKDSFSIALIGLGNRGKDTYLPEFLKCGDRVRVTAIAEPVDERREEVARRLQLPPERCFRTGEELLAGPRLADAACIATMDRQHVPQAVPALEKGYDLLLEKPVSPSLEECARLARTARRTGRRVVVCHVLRYTPFYRKVKELLEAGAAGTVMTIQAIENVGYWHQAHSFVRGNWRDDRTSSPMLLQKCCHDLDLYLWLAGKSAARVSSFGANSFFNAAHAPAGAADRCLSGCAAKENCPFDAEKIYLTNAATGIDAGNDGWPCEVLAAHPTHDSVREAIRTGPYGRCVFACDNNVVDHQVVNVEMSDGSTLGFTMTGFTQHNTRFAKFMGTAGELTADLLAGEITLRQFGQPEQVFSVDAAEGHSGGDAGLVRAFVELMLGGEPGSGLTSLDVSLESHSIALAAASARVFTGFSFISRRRD